MTKLDIDYRNIISNHEKEWAALNQSNNDLKHKIRCIDPMLLNEPRPSSTNNFIQLAKAVVYFIKYVWSLTFGSLGYKLNDLKRNEDKLNNLKNLISKLKISQQRFEAQDRNIANLTKQLLKSSTVTSSSMPQSLLPLSTDSQTRTTAEPISVPKTQTLSPSQHQFCQQIVTLCVSHGWDESHAKNFANKFFPPVLDIKIQPDTDSPSTELKLDITFPENYLIKIQYGIVTTTCKVSKNVCLKIDFKNGIIHFGQEQFVAKGPLGPSFQLRTIKINKDNSFETSSLALKTGGFLTLVPTKAVNVVITKSKFETMFH